MDTQKSQALAAERKLAEIFRNQGYDTNQLIDFYEKQALEAEAEQVGVDPQFYQEIQGMRSELNAYKIEKTIVRQDTELQKEPFYNEWKQEIYNLALQNGTDLETAYTAMLRQKLPDIVGNVQRKGEQGAIQKILNRDVAAVGPVNGAPAQLKTDFASMKKADFEDMIEKAKRGELKNIG